MMHKLDRRAFCFVMGLIGLGAGSIDVRAEDGAIRLGLVAPMSGPNARYGSYSLRGAQLAVEEINNAGGVAGRKIAITSGDSQGTPVEGVSATRRLIDLRQSRFHHRRRIELGDARHAARRRGRRRTAPECCLVQSEDYLRCGCRRFQMDVPQLSDRRKPRPHRHPICRRKKRLHEVCRSFGR